MNNIIFSLSEKFNENIITKLKKRFQDLVNKRSRLEQEANDQLKSEDENIEVDFSIVDMQTSRRTPRTPRSSMRNEVATTSSSSQSTTMRRRTSRNRQGVSSALSSLRNMK